MTFQIYTPTTAPAQSREALQKIDNKEGFVPNIAGVLAGAPPVLQAFIALGELMEKTSFTPEEREVLFLTVSHFNGSPYCMAAHSTQAPQAGLTPGTVHALHTDEPLEDARLEALRQYTLGILANRGRPDDSRIHSFLAAGYKPAQALEILLAITLKTLTNYANRLAHPPIDDVFKVSLYVGKYPPPQHYHHPQP